MKQFSFNRNKEDELIIVPCKINEDNLSLALDTGASHTTIDITTLLLAGYQMSEVLGTEKLETAGDVIEASIFKIKKIESLGITKYDFKVFAYDFFSNKFIADFEGVIGLDFFKDTKFCIDLIRKEITIDTKITK